jgi:uncharacterized protein (TIGR02270 family)
MKQAAIQIANESCEAAMTINGIIAQLAEEAAFLHARRTNAVDAPHYSLGDLARLDERLEAQIDGLRVAGDAAWDICKESLEDDEEWVFVAAVLAFENGSDTRMREVMEAVGHDRAQSRRLISALGWMSYQQAEPRIQRFLASDSSSQRYLGIAASAIHRRDPGHHLEKAACDDDPRLKARALRAYGELGRGRELNPSQLRDALRADDAGVRFSAAWSATLAGSSETIEVLQEFVVSNSPFREKALDLVLRRMQLSAALSWQNLLQQSPDTIRLAVIGAGIIGDCTLVPWLIEQMHSAAIARAAGAAFTMITGADIANQALKGAPPEGVAAGPNDDSEEDRVGTDADADLPWPSAQLCAAWWDRHQGDFTGGRRYLLGKPVSPGQLRQVLTTGFQRQRSVAALELALMDPSQPLFEVRAPGFRQVSKMERL